MIKHRFYFILDMKQSTFYKPFYLKFNYQFLAKILSVLNYGKSWRKLGEKRNDSNFYCAFCRQFKYIQHMCPVNAHGTFCLSTSLTFCFHPSNDIKWKNGLPCVSKSFIDLSPFVCLVFQNFLILKLSFEIFRNGSNTTIIIFW